MNVITMLTYQALCTRECPSARGDLSAAASCCAFRSLTTTLQSVFGYTSFRPGQLSALLPALHGIDTFIQMATGAGKSLCMFLVPLAHSSCSVSVVLSPLNSLMDEQVRHCVF